MPLHDAVARGCSAEVVEALLLACPAAVRMRADIGRLPLHLGCLFEHPCRSTVSLLLRHYPEGAWAPCVDAECSVWSPGTPQLRLRRLSPRSWEPRRLKQARLAPTSPHPALPRRRPMPPAGHRSPWRSGAARTAARSCSSAKRRRCRGCSHWRWARRALTYLDREAST